MGKNIIATSQDPGGASAISPVIKELSQEGFNVIALNYGKGSEVLEKQGISLTNISEFGIESPSEEGFESPAQLESIIKKTDPVIVITGTGVQKTGYSIDRVAMLASHERCPSVAVLDLWQNYTERFSDPYNGQLILPTKIAIMDDIAKKSMVEEGFPKELLEVTGNPFFDSLYSKAREFDIHKREELRKKLGISEYFVATFFSGPIESDFGGRYGFNERDSFRMFLSALSHLDEEERKQIKILLKMHPREEAGSLDKIIGQYRVNVAKNTHDSREIVLASDVNASPFSTVLYESIAMDKSAIAIQPEVSPENERKLFTYQFREYIPILKNEDSVLGQMRALQHNQAYMGQMSDRRKKLVNNGGAKERVKNLIYRLID